MHIEILIGRVPIIDHFDGRTHAVDIARDCRGAVRLVRCRDVGSDAYRDLEFEAEPAEAGTRYRGWRSVNAFGQNDAADRMINSAEALHRRRGKSYLVTGARALSRAEQ